MRWCLAVLVAGIFLVSSACAVSDVSVFQGQYYDDEEFLKGDFLFEFDVYDAETGSNLIKSYAFNITTGTWGQWKVEVEDLSKYCSDESKDYFVEISVDGVAQGDRRRLTQFMYLRKNADEVTSGNLAVAGLSVNGSAVCLVDGTNCPSIESYFRSESDYYGYSGLIYGGDSGRDSMLSIESTEGDAEILAISRGSHEAGSYINLGTDTSSSPSYSSTRVWEIGKEGSSSDFTLKFYDGTGRVQSGGQKLWMRIDLSEGFVDFPTNVTVNGGESVCTVENQLCSGSGSGNSGDCQYGEWSSSLVYTGGNKVSYNDNEYEACYWNQGKIPETNAGVGNCNSGEEWFLIGPCGSISNPSDSVQFVEFVSTVDGTLKSSEKYLPLGTDSGIADDVSEASWIIGRDLVLTGMLWNADSSEGEDISEIILVKSFGSKDAFSETSLSADISGQVRGSVSGSVIFSQGDLAAIKYTSSGNKNSVEDLSVTLIGEYV